MSSLVAMSDIEQAAERIAPHIRVTPLLDLGKVISEAWSLHLKLEHLQATGSFKVRGAFNLLIEASPDRVVAASGGNFGLAVAHAAAELGIPATIFVPDSSPSEKTRPIADLGSDLHLVPGFYDEALQASRAFVSEQGGFLAHAYDQFPVVAGQGTIAREIESQLPSASTVLVPVGGGGLIAGVAGWYNRRVSIVAVEPERCPTLLEARLAGGPVDTAVGGIAASSLGARRLGDHCWNTNAWIDDAVVVSEDAIRKAQRWIWETARLHVEPAASVGIAALLDGRVEPESGASVVAVLSGANVGFDS